MLEVFGADEIIVLQWPEGGTLEGTITGAGQHGPDELTIALGGTISIQNYYEDGRQAGSATGLSLKAKA
ncbi:MAG: hypothetical protein QGD90_00565 [Candidatus Hydrogenedentes bacterium]|nr:hypothetical protein [Candidatus Hydrogenedentota bacterium]